MSSHASRPGGEGPKEPWRTLGLPLVLGAVGLLAVASLIGVALTEALGQAIDRVHPPRPRPSRVGTKVHNFRGLRASRRSVNSPESD